MHDHLVEADLVAIYQALAPAVKPREDAPYYDRRDAHSRDHDRIHPRSTRLVVHPASIRHSVTPNRGMERLAITCTVAVDRNDLFEEYVRHRLGGGVERKPCE
jgi:hypothetical protein